MLIRLKSNGTQHTISAETWKSMSRDTKRNYVVLNETEEKVAVNSVKNNIKPDTGKKAEKEKEKDKEKELE